MKIHNISKQEQTACPPIGPSFSCAPGAEVEVADVCGADLVASLPSVWAAADVKTTKKSPKKES